MSVKIQIFYNIEMFADQLTDLTAQATARGITNTIKVRNAPRDTGDLMDSVRDDREGLGKFIVLTDLPYSAAQEYGRPDLTAYTYTPYMSPGAVNGTAAGKMNTYINDAVNGAANRSGA